MQDKASFVEIVRCFGLVYSLFDVPHKMKRFYRQLIRGLAYLITYLGKSCNANPAIVLSWVEFSDMLPA
jgi:hypothetical protein